MPKTREQTFGLTAFFDEKVQDDPETWAAIRAWAAERGTWARPSLSTLRIAEARSRVKIGSCTQAQVGEFVGRFGLIKHPTIPGLP